MPAPEPELYMTVRTVPSPNGGPIARGFDVHVGDRMVGRLSLSKTIFTTWRDELKHYARIPKGYGIERSLADKLLAPGSTLRAIVVEVHHEDGRTLRYWTPATAWKYQGRTMRLSDSFGPQVFLPFAYIQELDRKYRMEVNDFEGQASPALA